MTKINERAAKLRELAEKIRNNIFHAESIAQGFELIADCIEPCIDCTKDAATEAAAGSMGGSD